VSLPELRRIAGVIVLALVAAACAILRAIAAEN